jgi:hypothetical protein
MHAVLCWRLKRSWRLPRIWAICQARALANFCLRQMRLVRC